jgi:hypothetical protein
MYFNAVIASAILAFATGALAAPVPQLAGEGAAANSILSGTDNAVRDRRVQPNMISETIY